LLRDIRRLVNYVKKKGERNKLFSDRQSAAEITEALNCTLAKLEDHGHACHAAMCNKPKGEALVTSGIIADILAKPDVFELAKQALLTDETKSPPGDNRGDDEDFLHEEGET